MTTRLKQEAAEAAQQMLRASWNEILPVDPVEIARDWGVRVILTELPDDVSGALRKRRGRDPEILIETRDHPNRRRFSCAHELGHYARRLAMADDVEEIEEFEFIDLRDDRAGAGTDPEEMFANEFAACLLMPEEALRDYIGMSGRHVLTLSRAFGVSPEAMRYRLDNIGA